MGELDNLYKQGQTDSKNGWTTNTSGMGSDAQNAYNKGYNGK